MFSKAGLLVLVLTVFLVIATQARDPLDSRNHKQYARALLSKYAKLEKDLANKRGMTRYSDDPYFKRAVPAGCETCCSAWWCRMVNEDACLCTH